MLLRSSSAPFLSSLVPEGDNDCSASNKPFVASCHCNPLLQYTKPLSLKHPPSIRRARSDPDLLAFVRSFTEADYQFRAGQRKHQHISFSQLSMIQEQEQSTTSTSEANCKCCLAKEDSTSNRRPHSSGTRTAVLPASHTSSCVSAPRVHASFQGEVLSPFLTASETGISSMAEDLINNMNVGGDFHGRNGGRGSSGGCSGPSGNPHGDANTTDLYYQKLLQSDPQNPLFLRNYAQFLSEAKHDYRKSEEYYERAILASPNDGEVLSKYAEHVWDVHKDSERAGSYFDRAVKATPDDCYVLASHASFLWQSEEEDTNEATQTAACHSYGTCTASSPVTAAG